MISTVISLWGFLAVTVPIVLTPGASTAIVLRNSLSGGVRAGAFTALGVNAGSLCYGLLCAFGFTYALERWPSVWLVLRVAGALYLAWLGLMSLSKGIVGGRSRVVADVQVGSGTADTLQSIREGFVTNVANPAIATFYFVILPQFIPKGAPLVSAALILTAVHIALAASWHMVWAAAGATLARTLASGRPRQVLDLATGVALILLAVRMSVK